MAERKKPTKAELDEMDDFGQYISWLAKNNPKNDAGKESGGDDLHKRETKRIISEQQKKKKK